jgi:hypothetical protein
MFSCLSWSSLTRFLDARSMVRLCHHTKAFSSGSGRAAASTPNHQVTEGQL